MLWKQDVDLGFSLTPPHLLNATANNGSTGAGADDDIEKLKALKLDKVSVSSSDVGGRQCVLVEKHAISMCLALSLETRKG